MISCLVRSVTSCESFYQLSLAWLYTIRQAITHTSFYSLATTWHDNLQKAKVGISVSVPLPIGWWFVMIKARISADTIGWYIGYDKPISAYRLSVKFHRYANPVRKHLLYTFITLSFRTWRNLQLHLLLSNSFNLVRSVTHGLVNFPNLVVCIIKNQFIPKRSVIVFRVLEVLMVQVLLLTKIFSFFQISRKLRL